MKRLSCWARDHKHASRVIIIVSFIALNGLAVLAGTLLSGLGITLAAPLMLLFITTFLAAVAVYPSKDERRKKCLPRLFM